MCGNCEPEKAKPRAGCGKAKKPPDSSVQNPSKAQDPWHWNTWWGVSGGGECEPEPGLVGH